MEKRYGKIRKGKEEKHEMLLLPMESNLLKTHRKYPDANSSRLEEAILLALHETGMRLTGEQKDLSRFENKENILLKKALLYAFDPFENQELCEVLKQMNCVYLENTEELDMYYKEPVLCMLRIKESVELILKKNGADGYFDFSSKAFLEKAYRMI